MDGNNKSKKGDSMGWGGKLLVWGTAVLSTIAFYYTTKQMNEPMNPPKKEVISPKQATDTLEYAIKDALAYKPLVDRIRYDPKKDQNLEDPDFSTLEQYISKWEIVRERAEKKIPEGDDDNSYGQMVRAYKNASLELKREVNYWVGRAAAAQKLRIPSAQYFNNAKLVGDRVIEYAKEGLKIIEEHPHIKNARFRDEFWKDMGDVYSRTRDSLGRGKLMFSCYINSVITDNEDPTEVVRSICHKKMINNWYKKGLKKQFKSAAKSFSEPDLYMFLERVKKQGKEGSTDPYHKEVNKMVDYFSEAIQEISSQKGMQTR
ncbi:hypothetical protein KY358_00810 [Candidatus Woesearchaeota archaeon]|nr:hypothetical protein [Candidatus Woesearchaeota archaeon]